MKKVTVEAPKFDHLESAAYKYAEQYRVGLPELIRTAYVGWIKKDRESEHEFTFPGHGVLTMRNRDYRFVPTDEYARNTRFNMRLEGVWG